MQRNSPGHAPLQVLVCRYVKGTLQREMKNVKNTKYLAISHVWGKGTTWQRASNIDFDILVTAEKATFLSEQMPSIAGNNYFWMDILCVDQKNEAARVAVTQHIPTIFSSGLKTISKMLFQYNAVA
jgi:hypothetical protein